MPTNTITIGRKFYDDHRLRDCGESGVVLRKTKTTVTVLLDDEAWKDLHSDARYHTEMLRMGEWSDDPFLRGIALAAQRTLAAMNKVMQA